jgi:hypothetical protein
VRFAGHGRGSSQAAAPAPQGPGPPDRASPRLTALQRSLGNRGFGDLLRGQAAAEVGSPHDAAEVEADAVADEVAGRAEGARVDVAETRARGEEPVALGRRGAGKALPEPTRTRMEAAFGASFRHVRVHDDGPAAELSRRLRARAFTWGGDIFFAEGGFAPETQAGRHLLAHELAHVIQQHGAGGPIRRKAAAAPAPTVPVVINVTVSEETSGPEFFVRAVMQYWDLGRAEAEKWIEDKRVVCDHEACHTGVTADMVGKPIAVKVGGAAFSKAETEAVARRSAETARLPAPERDAINEEADRRFWGRTEYKRGEKLGRSSGEEGMRQSWLRAREGVLRDGESIEALPSTVKEFLAPNGRKIPPQSYKIVLRVAKKLEAFSAEDWALYRRRVDASTDDYERLEKSIDSFQRQQAAEQQTRDRIAGQAALYQQVQRFKATEAYMMKPPPLQMDVPGARVPPIAYPGNLRRYEAEKASVDAALAAAHFDSVAAFDAAVGDYVTLFRKRANEIALLVLSQSEQAVLAERKRYESAAENAKLFGALAPMRAALKEQSEAMREAMPTPAQLKTDSITPTEAQKAATGRYIEASKRADTERQKQAATNPILKDTEIRNYALDVDSAEELGEVLRKDADERQASIHKTRVNLGKDANFVLKLDRVVDLTKQELGVEPGSIYALALKDHQERLFFEELAVSLAVGALAIGLGLLTFGGGTVAIVAGVAGVGISAYQAGEEIEKYSKAQAAAHTSFDKALSVSGNDPSLVWVAVSLIAVGLDGAALASAVKAAAPAARVLAETSDVGKFEAELAKAAELSQALKKSLARSAAAEAEYQKAVEELGKAFTEAVWTLRTGFPAELLAKVTKAAYYAVKKNVLTKFPVFLNELKLQKFAKGIDFDKLTVEQMQALEAAFNTGAEQLAADAAKTTFSLKVPYSEAAGGPRILTFDEAGKILIDGKPLPASKYGEVYKQLDLTHAYTGHGPNKNLVDVMNEAKLNGPSFASGKFSSDQTFIESVTKARAKLDAGEFIARPGGVRLVEIEATPNVGRAFVRSDQVPKGVTPLPPLDTPAGVSELAVTKVRAVYGADGTLTSIYPIGAP